MNNYFKIFNERKTVFEIILELVQKMFFINVKFNIRFPLDLGEWGDVGDVEY